MICVLLLPEPLHQSLHLLLILTLLILDCLLEELKYFLARLIVGSPFMRLHFEDILFIGKSGHNSLDH